MKRGAPKPTAAPTIPEFDLEAMLAWHAERGAVADGVPDLELPVADRLARHGIHTAERDKNWRLVWRDAEGTALCRGTASQAVELLHVLDASAYADPDRARDVVVERIDDRSWCDERLCNITIDGFGPKIVVFGPDDAVVASHWGTNGVPADVLAACLAALRGPS